MNPKKCACCGKELEPCSCPECNQMETFCSQDCAQLFADAINQLEDALDALVLSQKVKNLMN